MSERFLRELTTGDAGLGKGSGVTISDIFYYRLINLERVLRTIQDQLSMGSGLPAGTPKAPILPP